MLAAPSTTGGVMLSQLMYWGREIQDPWFFFKLKSAMQGLKVDHVAPKRCRADPLYTPCMSKLLHSLRSCVGIHYII